MAKSESETGSFAADLRALLESGKGADVTLVAGDSHLPAHSFILAARSPVFAAMFRTDMLEASSRRIEITDVQEAVLQQMLCFIYTDTVPQLENFAAQLLAAAEKYDLPLLRERCERQMVQELSVENAAATAALAVLHHCQGLSTAAAEFIARHPKVLATSGWERLLRSDVEAAVDICKRVAAAQTRPAPQKTATDPKSSESRIVPEETRRKMGPMLLEAALCGRAQEVWALLTAGAPKDARDSFGNTALHLAAGQGKASTVKCLLDAGLDADAVDSYGQTPLHSAALSLPWNDRDTLWMLVAASTRVDAQDNQGRTALHVAARRVNSSRTLDDAADRVRTLLLAGLRKDIKDSDGRTPECEASIHTQHAFKMFCTPYKTCDK